jgi:hypothetical protein
MFPPEFKRIVKPNNIRYAEIYWVRGELGAPYMVWWDLPMCELRLKQYKGTLAEQALTEACMALINNKC